MAARESLEELGRLAETAGAVVVGRALQRRDRPNPATYIGQGKLQEIVDARAEHGYTVVIFDEQLSPGQQLRLEQALGVKVLDRSALILDIFASRARTREAALQVELAQHEYLLPRLRGQWQHLERMEGSIGSRGPGETQLETDRRLIGRRISRLRSRIDDVRRQRALHRDRRRQQGIPVVALVGYTNAGKSSLLRALTGADALAADALFATLDPLTRRTATAGGRPFLLTDTVGFIQQLPAQLVSAFRATLEELEAADLFLHVVDATAPTLPAQVETVERTLADLSLVGPRADDPPPIVTVLNKADALPLPDGSLPTSAADLDRLEPPPPFAGGGADGAGGPLVVVSALRGWGIDRLREALALDLYNEQADQSGTLPR